MAGKQGQKPHQLKMRSTAFLTNICSNMEANRKNEISKILNDYAQLFQKAT